MREDARATFEREAKALLKGIRILTDEFALDFSAGMAKFQEMQRGGKPILSLEIFEKTMKKSLCDRIGFLKKVFERFAQNRHHYLR